MLLAWLAGLTALGAWLVFLYRVLEPFAEDVGWKEAIRTLVRDHFVDVALRGPYRVWTEQQTPWYALLIYGGLALAIILAIAALLARRRARRGGP
jgi:hypothetical protein